MKSVSLGELFTNEELDRALTLLEADPDSFVTEAVKQIVEPALPRIDKVTGQPNDARFIAHALKHTLQSNLPSGPRKV